MEGPREPGTGAHVVRRSPTHRDPLGSFALVRGSPIDSGRPCQTSRACMACRRSRVRIPLDPLFFVFGFDEKTLTIGSGPWPNLRKRSASRCCVACRRPDFAFMRERQRRCAASEHVTAHWDDMGRRRPGHPSAMDPRSDRDLRSSEHVVGRFSQHPGSLRSRTRRTRYG